MLGGLGFVMAMKGNGHPSPLPTETPSFATSPAISTGTPPTTSNPDPQQTWFNSTWWLPQMTFGTPLSINYSFSADQPSDLGIVLCQTNATGLERLTSDNTWTVLSLPRKFGLFQYAAQLLTQILR
jgi:hypothetical protein